MKKVMKVIAAGIVCTCIFCFGKAIRDKTAKVYQQFCEETEPEEWIDFNYWQNRNADVYAWIRIPGTKIDYPVVQGDEDGYYLSHDIDKESNIYGAIYTEKVNGKDFSSPNTVLYGHHMKDGSMFRGLRNFLDDEFLKEHHILYLYLPDEGVWIFVIVKCEYTPADGDAFLLGTQEEVPTLLLSTCGTDASKRLVVWCERQEDNKEVQMKYSDEKTEVQKATDDLAFLDGEFVENEPHDFI